MVRTLPVWLVFLASSFLPLPAEAQQYRTSPVVTRTRRIQVQFTVADVVHVRTRIAPVAFDDKGRPQKLAREDLLKFKGDTPAEQKMEGYKWDFDNLQRGDIVQVFLSVPAGSAKKKGVHDDKDDKAETKTGRWVPVQQLTGVIKTVSARDPKKLTLQVLVTTQRLRGLPDTTQSKVTIGPDQEQATTIVVLQESGEPPPKKPKKSQ